MTGKIGSKLSRRWNDWLSAISIFCPFSVPCSARRVEPGKNLNVFLATWFRAGRVSGWFPRIFRDDECYGMILWNDGWEWALLDSAEQKSRQKRTRQKSHKCLARSTNKNVLPFVVAPQIHSICSRVVNFERFYHTRISFTAKNGFDYHVDQCPRSTIAGNKLQLGTHNYNSKFRHPPANDNLAVNQKF